MKSRHTWSTKIMNTLIKNASLYQAQSISWSPSIDFVRGDDSITFGKEKEGNHHPTPVYILPQYFKG